MTDSTENAVVLVTGSSGLIGSAFIARASDRYETIGFDRQGPPDPPPATNHAISCDLASEESVQEALEEVRRRGFTRIASVIHLAAYYNFQGEPSPLYEEVTVKGTKRLLDGLEDFEVGQFVFSSTMLVHKPCKPGRRISEDSPVKPSWDYPQSKARTEELIRAERGDVPAVLLRIAGIYDDRCHSIVLANQIKRIREKAITARVYPGDLKSGQAFLHLDDMVRALEAVVERRHALPPMTELLLGEPETLGYADLQRQIGELLHNERWETQRIPKVVAKSGARLQGDSAFIKPWMIDHADDHYALDVSRAEELLGWRPEHSLRETLPRMVAALKEDPERWYSENKLDADGAHKS